MTSWHSSERNIQVHSRPVWDLCFSCQSKSTGCGSANKRFWGSHGRRSEWVPANSCIKAFKKSGTDLCPAIAAMTRSLCTEFIDPLGIEAILANRLIPLDKGEGAVRPIGVGEVIRTIMGKCVMNVTKPDVITQPRACYAAFTFGLRHRWTYFLRTLPDISELLKPLERAINEVLIPAVTDHTVTKVERNFPGLPVGVGGLGFTDPVVTSSSEYEASIKVTNPLVRQIVEQEDQPPDASEIQTLQLSTRKQKDD